MVNTFPGNRLWAFTDTGVIANPLNPFPYKDSISYQNLSSSKALQNFIGVKLGDVNFDWNNAILRPAEADTKAVVLYHEDINAGNEIRIPIKVKNFREILGLQFTIDFNSSIFEFKGIENNRLGIEYTADKSNEGKLAFIWNDKTNKLSTVKDGEILMELVLNKKKAFTEEEIKVTSDITNAEAWDGKFKKHDVLKEKGKIIAENLSLNNNEDWNIISGNRNSIGIKAVLLKNKHVTFDIFNTAGTKLLSYRALLQAGINKINIPYNNLAPGIYYIKSTGINSDKTKKLFTEK